MFVVTLTADSITKASNKLRSDVIRGFGKVGELDGKVLYLAEWIAESNMRRYGMFGAYDKATGALLVRHVCTASENGQLCWHVAAMARLMLADQGMPDPEEGQAVEVVSAPVLKGLGLTEDLSHERGIVGDWSVLEPGPDPESVAQKMLAKDPPRAASRPRASSATSATASTPALPPEDRTEVSQAVARYLSDNGIPEAITEQVLERRRWDLPQDLRVRVPKSGRFFGSRPLKATLAAALLGRNVMLLGPAGTGKNVLADSLAWCLGLPQYTLSGNPQLREDRVIGADTFRKDRAGTAVVMWKDGRLATAMRNGGQLVFDEMNMTPPELAGIFAVLDWRKTVETDEMIIRADEHFCLVGTGNRGYAGTNEINRAMLDRFVVVDLSYEDVDLPSVLKQEARLRDMALINDLTEVFDTLCKVQAGTEVGEEVVTVRGLVDAAVLVNGYSFTLRDALTMCVVNKIQGDEDRETIRTIIEGRFKS